ncbi:hypothetical protein DFH09DRAFT_1086144 [Mycena vulgaris]|nr:hypothetical protein DFH09DRAFT_1086144 [Mycena vulgaris]
MTPTSILAAVYVPRNEQLVLNESYPIHELEDNEIVLEVAPGVCYTGVASVWMREADSCIHGINGGRVVLNSSTMDLLMNPKFSRIPRLLSSSEYGSVPVLRRFSRAARPRWVREKQSDWDMWSSLCLRNSGR